MDERRVALVTGSGSGIGRACAVELDARGFRIVATDRRPEWAHATATPLHEAVAIELDVREEESVGRAVEQALDETGRIDVLVNNAGVNSPHTAIDTSVALWDEVFSVNVRGMFLCARAVLPHMIERGSGSIVNMGSASSLVGMYRRAAYGASKGAVLSLTRCLAMDHVDHGIRVNCVCPGSIDTPWVERLLESADDSEEMLDDIVARQPMRRLGTAEEIAKAVAYLAGDDASYVTGATLAVDGGWTAR